MKFLIDIKSCKYPKLAFVDEVNISLKVINVSDRLDESMQAFRGDNSIFVSDLS